MESFRECAAIPVSKFTMCTLMVENNNFVSTNQFHRQHLNKFYANYAGALFEHLHSC